MENLQSIRKNIFEFIKKQILQFEALITDTNKADKTQNESLRGNFKIIIVRN